VIRVDIRTIIKIDELIKRESTGSPQGLSNKLGLSERAVYKYLKFMKEDLKAPIEFSKNRISYIYTNSGEFNFKWR